MINPKQVVRLVVLALPAVLIMLLTGCKDKQDSYTTVYNYEYFPLDSGHYVTYQVDSISSYRSDFQNKDTVSYQQMEVIGDTTYDNQNEIAYEINVYTRPNSSAPWTYDRKWQVKRTLTNLQKSEDDLRFIKLVFPAKTDEAWNGNIFLPVTTEPLRVYENWDYHYTAVDVPNTVNGFNLDSTLVVSGVDESNFIARKYFTETYAKNIGMVYREWNYQTGSGVNFWQGTQWNGYKIKMQLIDHN